MSQPQEKRYTYADYSTWDDATRYELIDGTPYAMTPGPSQRHQEISGEIFSQLHSFLKGKPCKVFHAPFDVRLNAEDYDDTVVQPDIVVVCDKAKLDGKSCVGAPDMVVEILSPSTATRDAVLKLHLYQRAGVNEYWIIDPESKKLTAYIMSDGRYYVISYTETDTAPVHVLEGCQINLADVFAE